MPSTKNILYLIISITVGLLLIATILPVGLQELYNVSWPASMPSSVETLLTTVVPIMAAISVVLAFIAPMIYKRYRRRR